MPQYTATQVYAIIDAIVGQAAVSRIMTAAVLAESGGDPDAVGDNGASLGWYQIHRIHGLGDAPRRDPDFATRWMYDHEFARAYLTGQARGYAGELLCRWTCMAAERPEGWQGPADPGLNAPAADRYAAAWRALGDAPMPTPRTYDSSVPAVVQTDAWSCSVASLTWALRSIGIDVDYHALQAEELRAGLVSTTDGLLVASGEPLADWITARFGVSANDDPNVSWEWLYSVAGWMPILLGGRHWGPFGHWVGVRGAAQGVLTLANPAEGYAGIGSTLTAEQFRAVGPCSAVWLVADVAASEEEDMGKIDELESLVGVLKDAGRVAREEVEKALAVPRLPKAAREALQYGALPACQTIERGAAPAED